MNRRAAKSRAWRLKKRDERLKQRAIEALGVETLPSDGRRIFRGGTLKMSVAFKGFELTNGSIEQLSKTDKSEILAAAGIKVQK